MNIKLCYEILGVSESSSNEEIGKAFKKLALQFHPDRNRDKTEWANKKMASLNSAYNSIMGFRFSSEYVETQQKTETPPKNETKQAAPKKKSRNEFRDELQGLRDDARKDFLINSFAKAKDDAKDALYRYFQYRLYNFHQRDTRSNTKIYERMVISIRKAYHVIKKLAELTDDRELLEHFHIFSEMIFRFYKSSECLNIIDSYNDRYEVHAFRLYRKADEILNLSEREIFYDRHNRGTFIRSKASPGLLEAEDLFREIIRVYPKSSWVIETKIKLDYTLILKEYLHLFFTE